jgi:hypothetical protein
MAPRRSLFAAALCFVATDARSSGNEFELFSKCPESAFPVLAEVFEERNNEISEAWFTANTTWAKAYIAQNPALYPGINASAAANVSGVSFLPKNYTLRVDLPKHNRWVAAVAAA